MKGWAVCNYEPSGVPPVEVASNEIVSALAGRTISRNPIKISRNFLI